VAGCVLAAVREGAGVKIHADLIQGSDEWLAARCGLITASEVRLIMTPTGKVAANDKARAHLWELLAQRLTCDVEPAYISDDMLRGQSDEIEARALYAQHFAPVAEVGFITREFRHAGETFTLGYSPDGLVGDDGLIECKSRRQKFQVQTIAERAVPDEYLLQIHTGLLVSGRAWCDLVSYCGGLPMIPLRVDACTVMQTRILDAAAAFEARLSEAMAAYHTTLATTRTVPTERRVVQEMYVS
jgi:predicted phage-related endonuclease